MDRRDPPASRCICLARSAAHSATYPNRFVVRSVPREAGGRDHRCAACRDRDRALAPVPGSDQARRPHARLLRRSADTISDRCGDRLSGSGGSTEPGAASEVQRGGHCPGAGGYPHAERRRAAALGGRVVPGHPSAPDPRSGKPSGIGLDPWPLPNLWPGVSVEDQDRIGRIRDLLQMPASRRWACFEPLLGPVRPDAVPVGEGYVNALFGGCYRLDGRGRRVPISGPAWPLLDWVGGGGEIGPGARPSDPVWVRGLRDGCVAAGLPFLFKQWGEWAPAPDDGFGHRMVRLGRRAAGRLVDGRSWDELPSALYRGTGRQR